MGGSQENLMGSDYVIICQINITLYHLLSKNRVYLLDIYLLNTISTKKP